MLTTSSQIVKVLDLVESFGIYDYFCSNLETVEFRTIKVDIHDMCTTVKELW